LPLVVYDDDADGVTLSAEVALDGVAFAPIDISPTTAATTAYGVPIDVLWDAAAFFGDSSYQRGLVVRITASDSGGAGRSSVTGPFAFGNDAPTVAFAASTITDLATPVSGQVVIEFEVKDTAADPAHVSLQF